MTTYGEDTASFFPCVVNMTVAAPHCSLLQEGGTENYYINNHLRFSVLFHKDSITNLARVVGFEVEAFRCVGHSDGCMNAC